MTPLRFVLFALALCAVMLRGAVAAQAPTALIAAVHARENQSGFLLCERVRRQEIKYPGHDEIDEAISSRVVNGTHVVAARLHRFVQSGKDVSAAELAAAQAQIDKKLPTELPYVLPAQSDRLAEFSYDQPVRAGKTIAIAFHSLRRDSDHADGTIYIAAESAQIEKIEYVANIPPKPANTASGTVTFAEVVPGVWELVRDEQHLSGKQFFITGTAEITVTHSHYRKFSSLSAAEKAL